MAGLLTGLLDLLYPPRCVFCRSLTEKGGLPVCPRCRDTLPRPAPGSVARGRSFTAACAPFWYEGDVRESLHRYKFGGAGFYAPAYGALLAERAASELAGEFDLITWVPLSRKRLRERGYDQARLLAEAMAAALGQEAVPTLEKCRDTPRQSQAGGREQRMRNVAGAYRASHPDAVRGRRVLLVDDILTTGATLEACAGVLRRAGAEHVVCAALARVRD